MRNNISTAALCVGLALAVSTTPARAQERSQGERLVTTTGEASAKRAPDQAWVTVGVEARAAKSQDAQKQAAGVMTAIGQQLEALGIPKDAIRTVGFSLNADWDYSNNKRTLRGYVVSNQVEVRVDDVAKVADVLDRSIAAGGNNINGVRWDIKDRDAAEREALADAVRDARARAEAAVGAAGASLGAVVSISEQRFSQPRPMAMMRMQAGVAGDMAETPISPGEIEIRSMVTVAFAIR